MPETKPHPVTAHACFVFDVSSDPSAIFRIYRRRIPQAAVVRRGSLLARGGFSVVTAVSHRRRRFPTPTPSRRRSAVKAYERSSRFCRQRAEVVIFYDHVRAGEAGGAEPFCQALIPLARIGGKAERNRAAGFQHAT